MDKRLASLLALSKKTGDRLVVFEAAGDAEPFVIMDFDSYAKLQARQQTAASAAIVSNDVAMAADMDLWEKTKQELSSPSLASEPIIASEPAPAVFQTPETPATAQETEANADDKYYFEEIDANES